MPTRRSLTVPGEGALTAPGSRRATTYPRPVVVALRLLVAFPGLLALSFFTRLPFVSAGFLNVDEAAHLLGADAYLRGELLYVDFADNKPPLVHLAYALAELVWGPGIESVRLFGACVLVPVTALAAAAWWGGDRRGIAAAVAFVVASAALLAADAHAVHCEHVMLVPLAWAAVMLRATRFFSVPWRVWMSGVLMGLAVMAKQPAAFVAVGFVGVLLTLGGGTFGQRVLRAGRFVLGALVPWVGLAIGLSARGQLDDAWFWIWTYNAAHVHNPMPLSDLLGRVLLFGSGLLPSFLPLGVAAALAHREPALASAAGPRQLLVLFGLCALAPALLGGRLFGHYFVPALFFAALAGGPYFARRFQHPARVAVAGFGLLCFLVVSLVDGFVHDPHDPVADVSRPAYATIGAAVREEMVGDCTVFVWGYAPTIYVHAGARPASRFVVPIDTLSGYVAGNDAAIEGRIDTHTRIRSDHWDLLLSDLDTRPPCVIVDTSTGDLNGWSRFGLDRFPRLAAFIDGRYRRERVVEGATLYVPVRASAYARSDE